MSIKTLALSETERKMLPTLLFDLFDVRLFVTGRAALRD
jgi:hypothetical protein